MRKRSPPRLTDAIGIGADLASVPGQNEIGGRSLIPQSVVVTDNRGGSQESPVPADRDDYAEAGGSVLKLDNAMVVDTAFGGMKDMALLVADKNTNTVHRVTGPFIPDWDYSRGANFIGAFNATSDATLMASGGVLTLTVTGMGNPGGAGFMGFPNPRHGP